MSPDVARLVAQRLALGSVALVAPRTAGRLFGLDFEAHSQAAVLTRLFAARHVALGAGLLLTDGPARRALVRMNGVVDAVDLVGVALETRRHSLPRVSSAIGGVTAATALALSIAATRSAP
jgi:hypothetical protein